MDTSTASQSSSSATWGAAEVVTGADAVDIPVDGAIDLVGGSHLVAAYRRLTEGGTVVAVGHSAGTDETFPYGAFSAIRGATIGRSHPSSCWDAAIWGPI